MSSVFDYLGTNNDPYDLSNSIPGLTDFTTIDTGAPTNQTPTLDYNYGISPPYTSTDASSTGNIIGNGIQGLASSLGDKAISGLLNKVGGFINDSPLTSAAGGAGLAYLLYKLLNPQQQQAVQPRYTSTLAQNQAQPYQHAPYFTPLTNAQRAQQGTLMGYKEGGPVHMRTGDFVFSKKALDRVGGVEGLHARGYPAMPITGPGTGTSDSIPATIDGSEPARVANGEALIRGGANMDGLQALHNRMRRA